MKKFCVLLTISLCPFLSRADHAFNGLFYNAQYGIVVETHTHDGILFIDGLDRHHRERFYRTCSNEFEDRSGRRLRFQNNHKFILKDGLHGHKLVFKRLNRHGHHKATFRDDNIRHWHSGDRKRPNYGLYVRDRKARRKKSCR